MRRRESGAVKRNEPRRTPDNDALREEWKKSQPSSLALLLSSCVVTVVLLGVVMASSMGSTCPFHGWTIPFLGSIGTPSHPSGPFPIIFTADELARYDGTNPNGPIYLSVKGHVFDVSAKPHFYGPGAGYHIFAGQDASRSFATGCFNRDQDSECMKKARELGVSDLDESEMKEVNHWLKFYQDHEDYPLVGYFPTSPSADEIARQGGVPPVEA